MQREHADGDHRHIPEPAELNQGQNDEFAEHSPALHGVDDHKARHAVRRRRGEQRVQETDALAAAAGEGQRKQNGAYQDHKREADDDGLCRREVNLGDQPQVLLDF